MGKSKERFNLSAIIREIKKAPRHLADLRQRVLKHERANKSELRARRRYGDKAVDAAIAAAIKAKRNQEFFERDRPYPALMKWYRSINSLN
jgi:hypothetical protein